MRIHPLPPLEKPAPAPERLVSCPCTQERLESLEFGQWRTRLGISWVRIHRKDWEFGFICQALHERGMLQAGRKGLGFAVGNEPLPALFASLGCDILASDMAPEGAHASGWSATNQHCSGLDALNRAGICPPEVFDRNMRFRYVDMRDVPSDLTGFDFLWSSCSMEHLGSIAEGERFVYESLRCLKPGGWAVHTTEFNVSSNDATAEDGGTVLFRRRDLERIAENLRAKGHEIRLDFTLGGRLGDLLVQKPPYTHDIHLRLEFLGFVMTSFGLIVRKASV